jgi:hypothetical protein
MNTTGQFGPARLAALLMVGMALAASAQPADQGAGERAPAAVPERTTTRLDESAFRIVAERNIFNANRIGPVRVTSPRRPSVVESFTLVGTMDYEKGEFAFFEGSSSELTKVLKPGAVIAGHKLLAVSSQGVRLEADGREIDLPVGSQMRREDEGLWQVAEARFSSPSPASNTASVASRSGRAERSNESLDRSRRGSDSSSRRGDNSESVNRPTASAAASGESEDEVLKRLMERRERESQ